MDYNLVTVEWEVNEITIEDKYEIVLHAVYEADVPAAVVVAEPPSVTLPEMHAGDVYNGEFNLTNYGLIRADGVQFNLPADDQYFRYEIMQGLPDQLEAKEQLTVAYRAIALKSLDGDDTGDDTGGGCYSYSSCTNIPYSYQCSNGSTSSGSARHCTSRTYGTCSSAQGVPG
ncbi:MAG: hypothetical protein GY814_07340, partial [Gammaproteobacteria bacterium]|nr:hypothetical protein [Gammaproteobacteria bacterium]